MDHTAEHQAGAEGQTRAVNLGSLSRRVHRAKTHGGWRVKQTEPGIFHWLSPGGQAFLVGPDGTTPETDEDRAKLWSG